jgi:hypothetical protein
VKEKKEILVKYLPEQSVDDVMVLLRKYPCQLKITKARLTKHGDFRRYSDGRVRITINNDANPYRFLITLIHELSHLAAYNRSGRVKPHGKQWQSTFQQLMLPFLRPDVFPESVLSALASYLIKPRASTDGHMGLSLALREFDQKSDKSMVVELPEESLFLYRDKTFVKGSKRRTRFECTELATHKKYVFHPHAEVEPLRTKQIKS